MGGVTSDVECAQCGFSLAIHNTNSHGWEWSVQCFRCGFSEWITYPIDRKKQKETGELHFKRGKDGWVRPRRYRREGCGAFCVKLPNGWLQYAAFWNPKTVDARIKALLVRVRDEGAKIIYITKAKGSHWQVVCGSCDELKDRLNPTRNKQHFVFR